MHALLRNLIISFLFLGSLYSSGGADALKQERIKHRIFSPPILKKITEEKKGRLFFYTSPRSGTHWMRYILTHLTHRLIIRDFRRDNKKGFMDCNFATLPVEEDKPLIFFTHFYREGYYKKFSIPFPNIKKDKILLLVRNPVESIIRKHMWVKHKSLDMILKYFQMHQFDLYNNLKFFETWPKENRLIIYYEDLLTNPKNELKKLLSFLDEPIELLSEFMSNIDTHTERSIEIYNKVQGSSGGSHSKGKNLTYHSENISENDRKALFDILEKQNPYLFKKYLAWYEEFYE